MPAPPPYEIPAEFIPARTKYPRTVGDSPMMHRMSGVKDSGQFTNCMICRASKLGILRRRELSRGSRSPDKQKDQKSHRGAISCFTARQASRLLPEHSSHFSYKQPH